jgi:23S rRNA pseudouridine1911/1915/1917 synthase
MTVLGQTDEFIVCIKPRGIVSQGAQGDMLSLLREETGREVYPVHRLDRETAGVMVFAFTPAAAARLSAQITRGEIKKRYYAVTKAGLRPESGEMTDLLFRDKAKNKTYVVKRERKGVRQAKLEYSLVCEKNGYALWEILLHTGRTHQIRVQFSSRGYPLAGDRRYGGEKAESLGLFAFSLEFTNPLTGSPETYTHKPETQGGPFSLFGEIFL